MIRLVLYFFRNLTAIPDLNMLLSGTAEQIKMSHMQELLVMRFYESDVIELLLTISSNSANRQDSSEWNVLVLEILYNLLEHVDPKSVFQYRQDVDSGKAELNELSSKLSNLLNDENERKRRKHASGPSRHNRFGGTYTLEDWGGKRIVSHKQQAGYADLTEIVDGEKKESRNGRKRKLADETRPKKVYQNLRSLMYLKATAQSFLESCFNAFFSSILKDMRREDKKIVRKDYIRYYFCMKWFLQYHLYEKRESKKRKNNTLNLPTINHTENEGDILESKIYDFDLVANAFDLGTILFCLQRMRIGLDEKSWVEVQVTADCIRHMLISVHEMTHSDEEEYRDVAEHIQSNLYYDQSILDLFFGLVKAYRNQSKQYLKTVVTLTHVLLKMLEKYSQTKKALFVKKKRTMPKKKKEVQEETMDQETQMEENYEESEEEYHEKSESYNEQLFQYSAFEKRYANVDTIHAYCTLLEDYKELEPEYIHYIVSFFHRMMVKRKTEYLFWKLPVMELFHRILAHASRFPRTESHSQLLEFIHYSMGLFFNYASTYPLLIVEALSPGIKTSSAELDTFVSKPKTTKSEDA
ncbi:timeless protein-domain-containing protein [Sporodiniella umbellata]|nr:timeless protein-domain-containing protein [Sporodiniella umbellata]